MKKTILLAVMVVAMLSLMVGTAFAFNVEGTFDDTTYGVSDFAVHSGYDTSTNACKFCHDVHGNANDKLFIAANMSDGCNVCHDDAGVAGPEVYVNATVEAEHAIDAGRLIPDSSLALENLGCLDCHDSAPHGMGQGSYWGVNGGLISFDEEVDFCVSCHDENDGRLAGATGVRTSGTTHVMADLGVAYEEIDGAGNLTAHADTSSADCTSCHVSADDDFPHSSATEFKFLTADAAESALDDVCLDCHGDGASTGVGVDY